MKETINIEVYTRDGYVVIQQPGIKNNILVLTPNESEAARRLMAEAEDDLRWMVEQHQEMLDE